MVENVKIIVVMPAYNAEKTLEDTVQSLPHAYSEIILCDDGSKDRTVEISKKIGITTFWHKQNRGYGANQKTLYREALARGAEIIVMVHPDNQYDTHAVPDMIERITKGDADIVLGSRMESARECGMPWWKYCGNRFLTIAQNHVFGLSLSEYHSGLRAYSASALTSLPIETFSDDFLFDSQIIEHAVKKGFRIAETSVHCYYRESASSVGLWRSIVYGIGTLGTLFHIGNNRKNARVKKFFNS